jgi:hypothetical protein
MEYLVGGAHTSELADDHGHRSPPFSISARTSLAVAVACIHSTLVQVDGEEDE